MITFKFVSYTISLYNILIIQYKIILNYYNLIWKITILHTPSKELPKMMRVNLIFPNIYKLPTITQDMDHIFNLVTKARAVRRSISLFASKIICRQTITDCPRKKHANSFETLPIPNLLPLG